MKTIDIKALEWFDKVNGNSYFAGTVIVDYGMPTMREYKMPYQYGYGSQYEWEAAKILGIDGALWRYCEDNNIILRTSKVKALKRELKNI